MNTSKIKIIELCSEIEPNIIGGLGVHTTNLVNNLMKESSVVELTVISYPTTEKKVITKINAPSILGSNYKSDFDILLNNFSLLSDKRLNSDSFNIIHCQDFPVGLASLALQERLNIPLVVTLHETIMGRSLSGGYTLDPMGLMLHEVQKRLCEKASKVICVSKFVAREAQKYLNCSVEKIEVVYNGSPKISQNIKNINKKDFNLLYVGRFVNYKGILDIINAAELLVKLGEKFKIQMIGSNPNSIYEKEFHELIKEKKLENYIEIIEFKQNKDLDKYYKQADIVMVPSHYEPFGITVLEAMSYGVLTIASNVGGLTEIIENEKNGFLIPQSDPKALAEMILSILKMSESEKEGIIVEAKKRCLDIFDWKILSRRTIKIFEEVTNV